MVLLFPGAAIAAGPRLMPALRADEQDQGQHQLLGRSLSPATLVGSFTYGLSTAAEICPVAETI